jgi:PQQ-dependent dehydrogenase (methanol/ethanol family)
MGRSALAIASAATLLVAAATPASANESVAACAQNPANWCIQTGNYAGWRYSTLSQINRSNVGSLRVAWTFSTGVLRGHEGGPLVVGDVMYIHTAFPNDVFALDLNNDAKILWQYRPKQDPSVIEVMCCDTVNRGLAYADGKIFLHQSDTSLVALDAETGKEVWKVIDGDPTQGETGTDAPFVVKDKVIIGISGAEFGVRCHVTAYDIKSGKRVWRAYATGPDADLLIDPENTISLGRPVGRDSSLRTWAGDQWKLGGGSSWGYMAYDLDLNAIFYGTGNPSTWNPSQRAGPDHQMIDQKWAMTYFSRNVDTGIANWAYQMTPFDEWDYDGINEPILTTQNIAGKERKVLTHFDRNGFAYTIDRTSGEPLVAEKFDPTVNWASKIDLDKSSASYGRPVRVAKYSTFKGGKGADVNTEGICPSSLGAKNQQPAAFAPETNLFYVPTNHTCMDYEPFKVSYKVGQPYVGATLAIYPAPDSHGDTGNFIAWDGAQGKIVWSKPERFSVWSGALTTAGGIVFYGTLEGYLKAVDQRDGKELFKFKTPSGIVGNAMTYMHDGKQYVAVLSGVGGWAGIGLAAGLTNPEDGSGAVGGYAALSQYTAPGGSLTVFALP